MSFTDFVSDISANVVLVKNPSVSVLACVTTTGRAVAAVGSAQLGVWWAMS